MTEPTNTVAIIERPQLQFFAVLQGFVDINDGEDGPEVSAAQIQEILTQSLDNVVANGGITGDSPGQVDVHESDVRVQLISGERTDEPLLTRVDRLEAELKAVTQVRSHPLERTTHNDQVEQVMINLVNSWRSGNSLDELMRTAEQVLQLDVRAPSKDLVLAAGIGEQHPAHTD